MRRRRSPTSSGTGARSWSGSARPGSSRSRTSSPSARTIAEVRAAHEGLAPGIETESRHRVAGRLVARRGHGKACFLDLRDGSGQIQLHAREDLLGEEAVPAAGRARPRRHRRRRGDGDGDPARRRALAGDRPLAAAGQEPAAAARQVPRPRGRRDPLPPPRARPDRQRGEPPHLPRPRRRRSPRPAAGSTSTASSRSRRRSCSRSTAAPWRGPSSPTTTRSTATSTCGSRPSST